MERTCSIAEARDDLSSIVREAESGKPVTLARRGQPVAVIVSAREYSRIAGRRQTVAEVVDRFRAEHKAALDDTEWLHPRDPAPGRAAWRP